MRLLTPHVPDDRGTPRPLCRPTAANIQPLPGETLFPLLAHELRGHRNLRWLIPVILVLNAAMAAAVLIAGAPSFLLLMALHTLIVPALYVLQDRLPGADLTRHDRRIALLASGRCASCAYPLHAQPPDPDGCTVCPECGAAWRLPSHLPSKTLP